MVITKLHPDSHQKSRLTFSPMPSATCSVFVIASVFEPSCMDGLIKLSVELDNMDKKRLYTVYCMHNLVCL